jgi:hypothetical protein
MGDAGRIAGGGLRNTPPLTDSNEEILTVDKADKVQRDSVEFNDPKLSQFDGNPLISKNPQTDRENRVSELSVRGIWMRDQLNAAPYSLPDPTADSLIKNNTVSGKVDTNNLAKELMKAAEKSATPKKLINETFDKLSAADRKKVGSAIESNLTDLQLKKLASGHDGREILDRIEKEMPLMGKSDGQKIGRLDVAKLEGSLESSRVGYGKLGSAGKKAVLDELKKDPTNFPKNAKLAELASSPGFDRIPDASRKELFQYVENNMHQPEFLKGLNQIVGNEAFQKLGDTERSKVLKDLRDFTDTPRYKTLLSGDEKASMIKVLAGHFPTLTEANRKTVAADMTKFLGTKTYINLTDTNKDFALRVIGDQSANSAQHPAFKTARNTLDQFLNEKVDMRFENFDDTVKAAAVADGKSVRFNVAHHGAVLLDTAQVITTSAHEVNHILNGKTPTGTPERFLDEYRAYYISDSAVGKNPPSVERMKRALNNLSTVGEPGDGYEQVRNYYKSNPEFKKVVDKLITDVNSNPPKFTDPEALRLLLRALPGNDKSTYLNTPGNMDNH